MAAKMITSSALNANLRSLPSYDGWDTSPESRLAFKKDVAQNLPVSLPHRLGMLAAIDNPLAPKGASVHRIIGRKPCDELVEPPVNRVHRAVQIGNEIIRLMGQLEVRIMAPLVWCGYTRPAIARSFGYLASASDLQMAEPVVDDESVSYELPTYLTGIRGHFSQEMQALVPSDMIYAYEARIAIPKILQLTGDQNTGKLLVGTEAVKYAESHAREINRHLPSRQ